MRIRGQGVCDIQPAEHRADSHMSAGLLSESFFTHEAGPGGGRPGPFVLTLNQNLYCCCPSKGRA